MSLEHEGRIVDFEGVDRQFGHNYASEYVLRVVGEPIKEIYRVIREASSSAFGVVPGAFPPTLGSGMAEFRWKVIPSNPSEDQMTEIFAKAIEDSTVRKDASLGAKPTAVSASPQDASSIEPQSQLVKRVCSFCQEAPGEVECDRCHGMFCYRHVNSYAHDCLELERKPETEHPIIATNRPHGSDRRWLIAVALVLLLVGAAGYGLYRSVGPSSSIGNQTANGSTSGSPSPPGGNTMTATPSTSFESMAVSNPSISDGKANITYPSQYSELSDFALASINKDRSDFGIGPVTLSSIPSGQQHADSMLYSGYFSHWDTQGYKPYMRFVLLGGKGAVAEIFA